VGFGESLKQERLRAGVPLEAVSEGTKVSLRHLEALERDDESELPGGVFNRGFIQSYCRFLGLDEAPWIGRYNQLHPPREMDPDDISEFAQAVKRNRTPATPLVERRWWGVLLMLGALAGLAWLLWHFILRHRLGY